MSALVVCDLRSIPSAVSLTMVSRRFANRQFFWRRRSMLACHSLTFWLQRKASEVTNTVHFKRSHRRSSGAVDNTFTSQFTRPMPPGKNLNGSAKHGTTVPTIGLDTTKAIDSRQRGRIRFDQ